MLPAAVVAVTVAAAVAVVAVAAVAVVVDVAVVAGVVAAAAVFGFVGAAPTAAVHSSLLSPFPVQFVAVFPLFAVAVVLVPVVGKMSGRD